MGIIHLLDEKTINKIAAGEVIENAASIVKELIENALDAQAENIVIELKNYGKDLISVRDDGKGMSVEDVRLCVLKHATSKIQTAQDLHNITTLGFRGEALSSIAAIAHLSILSCQKESIIGYHLELEGGVLKREGEMVAPKGTIIEVKDIFFNTPARRKFLQEDQVELKKIVDIVTRYALLHHDISFKLIHEKMVLLHTSATKEQLQTIVAVYGPEVARRMIEINFENEYLKIKGYVSKPELTRQEKSYQSFFVNKRYVKSNLITQALYNAYHSLLFVGQHPLAILSIELNPEQIDVNIHPTKQEIKIEQQEITKEIMIQVIRQVLLQQDLSKEIYLEEEPLQKRIYDGAAVTYQLSERRIQQEQVQTSFARTPKQEVIKPGYLELEKLPSLRLIGQVHKTYFLAEYDEGILLIDQHVVQERINYEKFMQELCIGNLQIQTLLQPEIMFVSPQDILALQTRQEELAAVGYTIELFGEQEFVIRTVPSIFGRVQCKETILQVAHALQEKKITALHEVMEEILTRRSCRASIMAGDIVTMPEMITYLKQLDACQLPFTCPHGRPVIIKMTHLELEKMFKRK